MRTDGAQHDGNVGAVIEIVTAVVINAPIETVFDLARDPRIHAQATAWTSEKVIECTTDGLLAEGDVVTFEARHLGVRQRLTSKVMRCDRPNVLVDKALKGAFRSLIHEHLFEVVPKGTQMTDRLVIVAPLGPLGWIAERIFLARYMRHFLIRKNRHFLQIVEEAYASK